MSDELNMINHMEDFIEFLENYFGEDAISDCIKKYNQKIDDETKNLRQHSTLAP